MSHRVILITGASAGIGRACAITLSNSFPTAEHPEPLVLVLVGRRQEELEKTGKLCKEGTTIEIGTGDVGKEEDVERIFGVVKEKYGRLDVLFNVSGRCGQHQGRCANAELTELQNAGVNLLGGKPIEENDMTTFKYVLETNIMAAVLVSTASLCGDRSSKSDNAIVYEAGFSAHEQAITTRRPNHQQRLHLRRCPSSK